MLKFYKQNSGPNEPVSVKNLLESIEKNHLIDELIENFELDKVSNETIKINYFNYVLGFIKKINREFEKEDIITSTSNVDCIDIFDRNSALFYIKNLPEKNQPFFGKKTLKLKSKRSVKKDYLDKRFAGYKFLSNLKSHNKDELMLETLEKLESVFNVDSPIILRTIRKIEEKEAYIRAISSDKYEDYNLNFSIVLLFIFLNKLNNRLGLDFTIEEIRMDDSHVIISISSSKKIKLNSGAYLSFSIEMVNDEIKRDACKFFSVMHIESNHQVINLKPQREALLSLTHKKTSLKNLKSKIDKAVENTIKDIDFVLKQSIKIDSIQKPEIVKDFIYERVKSKKSPFTEKDRIRIINEFDQPRAKTVINLLELLGKVDLIMEDEDIKSRDYWRNLLYNALIQKGLGK